MSDEEDWDSDDPRRQAKEEPLPDYTIRFTDMDDTMVKKAIRCKSNHIFISNAVEEMRYLFCLVDPLYALPVSTVIYLNFLPSTQL